MLNRGTREGNEQEVVFVQDYNKNKFYSGFAEYNSMFAQEDFEKIYLCRVVTKQFSKLSNQVVMTRADAYAVKICDDIKSVLEETEYYLDENILAENGIRYEFIPKSGISVKLSNSSKFQILKLTPNSFLNLFGNSELGAGASLYCKREDELCKNPSLLKGWLTSCETMQKFFDNLNLSADFCSDMEQCKKIKIFSEQQIKSIIDASEIIRKKVFNGIGLYEEPYTAHYLFKSNELTTLDYIPYCITTGSGRSKGIYTVVLKPL